MDSIVNNMPGLATLKPFNHKHLKILDKVLQV